MAHLFKDETDWFTCFGVAKKDTTSTSDAGDITSVILLENFRIAPLESLVLFNL